MMIIDMRLRPPISDFLSDTGIALYNPAVLEAWSKYSGTSISPAAKERSLDKFFEEMNTAGINKGIVHGRKHSKVRNESIVDFVKQYPDKFIGCPNIAPHDGLESCLKEIEEYVINGPCQGIFMEPTFDPQPWSITDEKLVYPIYEKCSENNIPILFTLGGMSYSFKQRAETLPAIDEISALFPNLKIVFCHGGWPAAGDVIQLAAFRGNIFISQDVYLLNAACRQDYIYGANCMVSNRILYGSAYPAANMIEAVQFYLNCGFDEKVLPKIMGENAAELFDGQPVKR